MGVYVFLGVSEGYIKHQFKHEADKIKSMHKKWKKKKLVKDSKIIESLAKKQFQQNGGVTRKEVIREIVKNIDSSRNNIERIVNEVYDERCR